MNEKKSANSIVSSSLIYIISIVVGVAASYSPYGSFFEKLAEACSQIFMNLLTLVSLPIIFFSIVSSATRTDGTFGVKAIGKKIVKYTLLTTLLASSVALFVFLLLQPVQEVSQVTASIHSEAIEIPQGSYTSYLLQIIPSNVLRPFTDGNIMSVLLLALFIGLVSLQLEEGHRKTLHTFFSSCYALFMHMTRWIVRILPVALFSFSVLLIRDMREGFHIATIGSYLVCVMVANAIQAFIVLPIFLLTKGISPYKLVKAMAPALWVAFFTKSSNATVPMAVQNAIERAKISPEVARFTFPLCTSINMNACAAFILITTLFISMSYGISFSPVELGLWVVVAAVAAIGNAGVPMGCYFLASALLASMHVPLQLMGIILPFYAIIDAFETAINVWSDSVCVSVVDAELHAELVSTEHKDQVQQIIATSHG